MNGNQWTRLGDQCDAIRAKDQDAKIEYVDHLGRRHQLSSQNPVIEAIFASESSDPIPNTIGGLGLVAGGLAGIAAGVYLGVQVAGFAAQELNPQVATVIGYMTCVSSIPFGLNGAIMGGRIGQRIGDSIDYIIGRKEFLPERSWPY